jgi:hypothetical protein
MKRLFLLVAAIALFSCKKDMQDVPVIRLEPNPAWETESFKTEYIIQFPAGYKGPGMTGFEGNVFFKNNDDQTLLFSYHYCFGLTCFDFGATLSLPEPDSIYRDTAGGKIILDQRFSFLDSLSQTAILYYNTRAQATGKLYWRDNGVYKEAMDISFLYSKLQEVLDILKTIRRR